MNTETYDHPVTEAMRRMRAFVLARGPLLMKVGGHVGGVPTEILSPEQRAAILVRLRAGEQYTKLAVEFAVDPKTIYHIARRAGIRRRRPISGLTRKIVASMYTAGVTVKDIALHHNISISAVRKILKS